MTKNGISAIILASANHHHQLVDLLLAFILKISGIKCIR